MDTNLEIKIEAVIPGYQILEAIHDSYPHVIYRANRLEDGQEIAIKTLSDAYPRKEDLLSIQREFRIISQLHFDGIIRVYDLVACNNGNLAIVMEYFGIPLADYLTGFQNSTLPLEQFFQIAIRLVEIYNNLHENRIVHKKLEPSNILIQPETGELRLIDFGTASEISRERFENFSQSTFIDGRLAYISPEQTGRINRDIDYRSDFYSAGVLFYQMLTGQLPFKANDPLEWVHCTISRQPSPPNKVNPKIPGPLSEIIIKLLSKNAENRYQSSFGLLADINHCREQVKTGLHNFSFTLGRSDVPKKFQIPQKLYGREQEVGMLENFFDHASYGAVEFCLVSGYSGIGKTVLVRELGPSIVRKNGYLIQGKFEQYKQNAAYSVPASAFRDLMRQLLGESKKRLEVWNEKITGALGANAQLIVDLIPELEFIIGKQVPVAELSPEENQTRFLKTFISFVSVFAGEGHPLVIFLDDLQWSDIPTLNLIERLTTSNELSHLLIIGAFRDNETGHTHPLSLTLREIRNKRHIEHLLLQPLSLNATNELIRDTLLCASENSLELSRIFYEKTGGNPFFTIELLKSLKDRGVITLNTAKGFWEWDIAKVKSENYSDNVIDVLVASQSRLHSSTQNVMQLAACIGTTFDLRTLSIIEGCSLERTGTELYEALRFNMIVPLDESYSYISPDAGNENKIPENKYQDINPLYKFQHDRVQQAAYSRIPVEKRKQLHLSIGRLMLRHSSEEEIDEKLMDIVDHLNEGRNLIYEDAERRELARYNLVAGRKAKQSSAYESSVVLLKIGTELLGETVWQNDYSLAWELHNELQYAYYLTGDWVNADALSENLLYHSRTAIEKAMVLSARTRQYATTQRMQESIQSAKEGLLILGFEFSANPTSADVAEEVRLVQQNLGEREIASLIDMPGITSEKVKIANQLLMEIFAAAFLSGSGEMFPYLVLKFVNLALVHGNSNETAFAYAAYGMLLCGLFDDPALGYEYGKLGVKLNEKLDDLALRSRIIYVYTMFVHHWSNHWSSMTPWFRKGIEAGYQSGDLLYLAYSAQDCIIWDPKLELEKASQEHRKLLEIVRECEYKDSLDSGTLFLQMQLNFQGLTHEKFSMTDDFFDENQCVEGMYNRHFMTGISNYHIYKAEIHLLYNDPAGALEHVLEQEKRMASVIALPQVVRFHIVAFLVRSMLLTSVTKEEQQDYLVKMHGNLDKVSGWATQCKENFEHLRLFMEAQLTGFSGQIHEALFLYEQAILMARTNGFIRDEAMVNEMAARLMLRFNIAKAAIGYLREAHYLYYRWGALRKVEDMETEYRHILALNISEKNKQLRSTYTKVGADSKIINTDQLDLNSVLKASQTISGELVLEKLLKSTLQVLIENAGAQNGFLVVQKNDKISLRAGITSEEDPSNPTNPPNDENRLPLLPVTLINTAIRTNEPVVLDNAQELNSFSTDPYIKKRKPLSVICVPLPLHGQYPSAIYLENNLTQGAFTEDRVKVIKLLASQASISMENARIYEQQKKLLKAQQRFVPSQFLKHLGRDDITRVKLGESISMEMSVMFADIRNFTPMVERQSPEVVIHFLNDLYEKLGASISDSEGFIDSYSGDAIMALFAVPPRQAIKAGIQMSHALKDFNHVSVEHGIPPVKIGIGLNTGPLVLGIMGANDRMQCSVLGDTVNLASRIEHLTRTYNAQLLIGESTYLALENHDLFSIRLVDYVAVKGKGQAVKLYEVLDAESEERREAKEATKARLEGALEAYYSHNFAEAAWLFGEIQDQDPLDPVLSIFLDRARKYVVNPPPDDWMGFENLEHK